jgi:hypothetical protein
MPVIGYLGGGSPWPFVVAFRVLSCGRRRRGDLIGEGSAQEQSVVGETPEPCRPPASLGRAGYQPPTREQLMAGSANLRRVYKVEE